MKSNNVFEKNDDYLEHLLGLGYKKERKNHKYIKKIDTPKGPRYFYTYADLKAYYAGQRAKDKLGFDERDRRNAAKASYEKAAKDRQKLATDYSNARFRDSSLIKPSAKNSSSTDALKEELDKARSVEKKAQEELQKSEMDYSKTALGKFDNLVQMVKKFGKKKVSDIVLDGVKKLSEVYSKASEPFKVIADAIKEKNVKEYPVTKSIIQRKERDIIQRLSGGDMTAGSCVSLAMAYAGNKAGYDVLDYRGGNSCSVFSDIKNIKDIAMLSDIDSKIIDYDGKNETAFSSAVKLLNDVATSESGKEFLLCAGGHMAVVKRFGDEIQYLEMQSGSRAYPNGWHTLDADMLIDRFGVPNPVTSGKVRYTGTSLLIDADSLSHSDEFLSLLSYINTPENYQQKGSAGHVK